MRWYGLLIRWVERVYGRVCVYLQLRRTQALVVKRFPPRIDIEDLQGDGGLIGRVETIG